jgi:hypothetical protein
MIDDGDLFGHGASGDRCPVIAKRHGLGNAPDRGALPPTPGYWQGGDEAGAGFREPAPAGGGLQPLKA